MGKCGRNLERVDALRIDFGANDSRGILDRRGRLSRTKGRIFFKRNEVFIQLFTTVEQVPLRIHRRVECSAIFE